MQKHFILLNTLRFVPVDYTSDHAFLSGSKPGDFAGFELLSRWFGPIFGSSSCWKLKRWPSLNLLLQAIRYRAEMSRYLAEFMTPQNVHKSPWTTCYKTAQKHPPLYISHWLIYFVRNPLLSLNVLIMYVNTKFDFGLIEPQHTANGSSNKFQIKGFLSCNTFKTASCFESGF